VHGHRELRFHRRASLRSDSDGRGLGGPRERPPAELVASLDARRGAREIRSTDAFVIC
jgi:hypothetical protein